jgi:Flp pilus assembly pilin Flp
MSIASPSITPTSSAPCGTCPPHGRLRQCLDALAAWVADEDGTTAVEYAVMVSMIAAFLIVSVGLMTQAAEESFSSTAVAIGG